MSSLKNNLLLICSVLTFSTVCVAAQRPSFLVTEKSIVEEFRGQLRSKLKELSQNYLTRSNGQNFVWFSNERIECQGQSIAARMSLTSVQQSVAADSMSFEWRGCGNRSLFRETFAGQISPEFNLKKYLAGEFPEGDIRHYRLEDDQRRSIFEWRKVGNTLAFYFMEQRFLDLYQTEQYWQYKLQGYQADYSSHGFSLGVDMRNAQSRLSVEWDDENVRLYNSDFQLISINSFLTGYSHGVQSTTLNFVGTIIQHLMKGLPSTEFVSNVSQNSRLLNELRITYTRLLNNLELNLVRQFVQELIAAVENGLLQITDNRSE